MPLIQAPVKSGGESFYNYKINESFKFDGGSYLSRTPSVDGNRNKWTWSGWVKRSLLSSDQWLFGVKNGTYYDNINFNADDTLNFSISSGTSLLTTAAKYRDTSSWYHIVCVYDSSNTTMRMYVNGVQVSIFNASTMPTLNANSGTNAQVEHNIGKRPTQSSYFNGYMAEVNFIDGIALTASSFGEFKEGVWIPKKYYGSYGTNGFYVPFKQDTIVEGFNTTTYTGNGTNQNIGGIGFSPDFVWIKEITSTSGHHLYDTVRGETKHLGTFASDAESTYSTALTAFNNDGFTVGNNVGVNESGQRYVAWCWDTTSVIPIINSTGDITSTVKANNSKGFSIVSYTGNGSTSPTSIGHSLSQEPDLIIVKGRNLVANWAVWARPISENSNNILQLNSTSEQITSFDIFDNPTSSTFLVKDNASAHNTNNLNTNYIAYCFHSVAGYSKVGSYTGTGASGNTVNLGFRPAWIMTKRADGVSNWNIVDNTRDPSDIDEFLMANSTSAELSGYNISFTDTGFVINNTEGGFNTSGGTYVYLAFADTRENTFWSDISGNNNNWTPLNTSNYDVVPDSSTNNFAVLNYLNIKNADLPLSEGNLKANESSGNFTWKTRLSTMGFSKGKYYAEFLLTYSGSTAITNGYIKIGLHDNGTSTYVGQSSSTYGYGSNGNKDNNGSSSSYGSSYLNGDIIGIAFDSGAGTLSFYKNGLYQGVAFSSIPLSTYFFAVSTIWNSPDGNANIYSNFGQDSSFSGNKTRQGNTDANGIGDFYYAPPTGFLALCSENLPEPDIINGSDNFNTVLWSGNATDNRLITGVGFSPDMTWIKARNSTQWHCLFDSVRGSTRYLNANDSRAEQIYADTLKSFDSDGFTLGTDVSGSGVNSGGGSYVGWNWKASDSSPVVNNNGSIQSTVSVNSEAGFSIGTYTGAGVGTVGHGLSKAPEVIIVKQRNGSGWWGVYHKSLTAGYTLILQSNQGQANDSNYWTTTAPNSSTFNVGTTLSTVASTYVFYAFSSVEGYSKFDSYIGNGVANGTFVYCGFKPAFVICKTINITDSWRMYDNKRDGYNPDNDPLYPNLVTNETEVSDHIDLLSNGFKLRSTNNNASNQPYIYIAFAENPFKYTTAK